MTFDSAAPSRGFCTRPVIVSASASCDCLSDSSSRRPAVCADAARAGRAAAVSAGVDRDRRAIPATVTSNDDGRRDGQAPRPGRALLGTNEEIAPRSGASVACNVSVEVCVRARVERSPARRAAASAISLKTATRAADRRRSSLIRLARIAPRATVIASETSVMTMSADSMPSIVPLSPSTYRSLNSTATSTSTSTGVPNRRAGANRHCRTASTAR